MLCVFAAHGVAQTTYTWAELRARFEAGNSLLRAGKLNIDEARAQEITAYLRPNPSAAILLDQFEPFNTGPYRPLASVLSSASISYLHERAHKRELRRESAQKATGIAEAQQDDLVRNLTFNLRNAFVQALQAKAVLAQAIDNLAQYDKVIDLNRERKRLGDVAMVDLDRIELQRVQFETDLQTATVNLRTAKINLMSLMNDRVPVDRFDITGNFDFEDQLPALDELRKTALEARPDLKAAAAAAEKARSDHRLAIANGSTDPTFGADYGRNPPITNYLGFSVSFPLRIFDRNQGERIRTQIDIRRNERLQEATQTQVFNDVDAAYASLENTAVLLRSYKTRYLVQATRVRDTINFSYQRGAASLLDFLQAQQEYRAVQVTYLNLVGSYLTAASQLNLAVGREVIP